MSEDSVHQRQFTVLCDALKADLTLLQLPNLISKLLLTTKECKTPGKAEPFSRDFLHLFSEAVATLPVGQSMELWKELLTAERFLLNVRRKEQAEELLQISILFAKFLLHLRTTESFTQSSILREVESLMLQTQSILSDAVSFFEESENEEVVQSILWLSYAWGELHLTLGSFCRAYNADWPIVNNALDTFDMSLVHKNMSTKSWTAFAASRNPQKSTFFVIVLLLIQKARALHASGNTLTENGLESMARVVNFVMETVLRMQHSESNSKWDGEILTVGNKAYFPALWSGIFKWLPLMMDFTTTKQLLKLCTTLIEFLQIQPEKMQKACNEESLKTISEHFVRSGSFAESRTLQSLFITALWKHSDYLFASIKRKGTDIPEEMPVEAKVIKYLHKHPKLWLEHAQSNPSRPGETETNEMWAQLRRAGEHWNDIGNMLGSRIHLQPKLVLRFVKMISHLSLGNLLPSNQIRCVLGLFGLQSLLRESDEKRFKVYTEISKCLVAIFDGVRYVWIMNFVRPSAVLRLQLQLLDDIVQTNSVSSEVYQWSKLLLKKIFICVLRKEHQRDVEHFVKELTRQKSYLKSGSLFFCSTLLKQLSSMTSANQHQSEEKKTLWKTVISELDLLLQEMLSFSVETSDHDSNSMAFVFESGQAILQNGIAGTLDKKAELLHSIAELAVKILQQNESEMLQVGSLKFLHCLSSTKENFSGFETSIWMKIWDSVFCHTKAKCVACPSEYNSQKGQKKTEDFAEVELSMLLSFIKNCDKPDVENIFTALLELANFTDIEQANNGELHLALQLCSSLVQDGDIQTKRVSDIETLVFRLFTTGCILLNQVGTNEHYLLHVAVPFLKFFHLLLGKGMSLLRSRNIIQCLQLCSAIPLKEISSTPMLFVPVYQGVANIINQILLEHQATTAQAVAPIFACVSNLLSCVVKVCECNQFDTYDAEIQQEIDNLIDKLTRICTQVVRHKEEFSKSAAFLVSVYVSEAEKLMVHPKLKANVLLCVYQLLNMCNEHNIGMLQTLLSHSGREIFKVLYSDYNNHYRYKGVV